jgi:hypothetical protein
MGALYTALAIGVPGVVGYQLSQRLQPQWSLTMPTEQATGVAASGWVGLGLAATSLLIPRRYPILRDILLGTGLGFGTSEVARQIDIRFPRLLPGAPGAVAPQLPGAPGTVAPQLPAAPQPQPGAPAGSPEAVGASTYLSERLALTSSLEAEGRAFEAYAAAGGRADKGRVTGVLRGEEAALLRAREVYQTEQQIGTPEREALRRALEMYGIVGGRVYSATDVERYLLVPGLSSAGLAGRAVRWAAEEVRERTDAHGWKPRDYLLGLRRSD